MTGVINAVLMFIPVWTFTAVCQADKGISVSCGDVTGFVGEKVILTCSVTQLETDCCVKMYMFKYPEKVNDSDICKHEPPKDPCDQRNSFTCSYTPATAMTDPFRFFLQTTTVFTVSIAGSSHIKDKPEDESKNPGSNNAVIATVVGLSVVIILILMTIMCVRRFKSSGLHNTMPLCINHDNDESNHSEDVI